eukprot:7904749-Ditylum_brightwellii.AAC.2
MFVPSATPREAFAHLFTTDADSDPLNAWNILDDSSMNLTNSQRNFLFGIILSDTLVLIGCDTS